MHLPDSVRWELRKLIDVLYSRRLDFHALTEVSPVICKVMNSHYFAFSRFSHTFSKGAILFSNNPAEFLQVYAAVQNKDFILNTLVENQKTVSLRQIPGWDGKYYYDFTIPVQNIRPISDVIYVPAKICGNLSGYWAIGRAGIHSAIYSEKDSKLFESISFFLTDAVARSFEMSLETEDIACLNIRGNVLYMGERIETSFKEIFGADSYLSPCNSKTHPGVCFEKVFYSFVRTRGNPWNSRFHWKGIGNKSYNFSFQHVPLSKTILHPQKASPTVMVVQLPDDPDKKSCIVPIDALHHRYGLTDREIKAVEGIYQGKTNKEIAGSLGLAESTVKRYIGSIYEKTGTTSRTSLIFRLSL
jgi:DNA-binding CsgD family transcriptional regulator